MSAIANTQAPVIISLATATEMLGVCNSLSSYGKKSSTYLVRLHARAAHVHAVTKPLYNKDVVAAEINDAAYRIKRYCEHVLMSKLDRGTKESIARNHLQIEQ